MTRPAVVEGPLAGLWLECAWCALECAWCATRGVEERAGNVPPGHLPQWPPVTLVAGTLLCAEHAWGALNNGACPVQWR